MGTTSGDVAAITTGGADEEQVPAGPDAAAQGRGGAIFDGGRIAALHDLGLLDTGAEEDFDRYTRLATELLGVPVSLVSLVDADRQFFKSGSGLSGPVGDARQTPLSHSFCQYAVVSQEPLVVCDAREHPLVADNLAIRDLGVIAYAGMPLVLSDGHAVGAFCAIDSRPHDWTAQELRILEDLAAAVRAHLELRKALVEQRLSDRLTGLPNRAQLCAQADQLLAAEPPAARTVAAISIGLDGFRLVNEAYGAAVADRLLQRVAERLAAEQGDGQMLGRLEGDVFTLLSPITDERTAMKLAERLGDRVADTAFDVQGRQVTVTATVGLALGANDDTGADLLSRSLDALRRAKASGRRLQLGSQRSAERASRQLRLRTALAGAARRGELRVVYQPIVTLDSGAPVGFEALARWESPELGSVSPAEFIPVAERSGEIIQIGEHVLRTACEQLASWRSAGHQVSIAVNLAPLQLTVPNLPEIVDSALLEHGLEAAALTLEITEGVLIGAGELHSRNLVSLRERGVRLALDDFGTGYSSLSYLTRFAIDEIKIDRSFVSRLDQHHQSAALVQAILAMASGLDLDVVAEGIETPDQHRQLHRLGCSFGQGYLFAPPRLAEDIALSR